MKDKIKEFGPSNWAINNKTAIYVITVLLSIIGYAAYQNLPKENFPEITLSLPPNLIPMLTSKLPSKG